MSVRSMWEALALGMMQDHDSDLADEPMKVPGQMSSAAVAVQ